MRAFFNFLTDLWVGFSILFPLALIVGFIGLFNEDPPMMRFGFSIAGVSGSLWLLILFVLLLARGRDRMETIKET